MHLAAHKVDLKEIQALRALFLQETNFQIRYNASHERGWTDSYHVTIDNLEVGYGSIKGQKTKDRDTIFEYFVTRPFRKTASELFQQLIAVSGAEHIECQSNDLLLSSMLYEFSRTITSHVTLFEDYAATEHVLPGVLVRLRRSNDQVFKHKGEPVGDYVAEKNGEVVATGGFLLHYNEPLTVSWI